MNKIFSYIALLIFVTSCSEQKISKQEDEVTPEIRKDSFGYVELTPSEEALPIESRKLQGRYRGIRDPYYEAETITLVFMSDGDPVENCQVFEESNLTYAFDELNREYNVSIAKSDEEIGVGVVYAFVEKLPIVKKPFQKNYYLTKKKYVVNYKDLSGDTYTADLDLTNSVIHTQELKVFGIKSEWRKPPIKKQVPVKVDKSQQKVHTVKLLGTESFGGVYPLRYTLKAYHPREFLNYFKALSDDEEMGYTGDFEYHLRELGGDLAIYFADDIIREEYVIARITLKDLQKTTTTIDLSPSGGNHSEIVNVRVELPEGVDEKPVEIFLSNIEPTSRNRIVAFARVVRGKRQDFKFPAGDFYIEGKNGLTPIRVEEGTVIKLD